MKAIRFNHEGPAFAERLRPGRHEEHRERSEQDERHRTRRDRGNGALGESDIEGKAAMGSGE
jgi:hypothetical protein